MARLRESSWDSSWDSEQFIQVHYQGTAYPCMVYVRAWRDTPFDYGINLFIEVPESICDTTNEIVQLKGRSGALPEEEDGFTVREMDDSEIFDRCDGEKLLGQLVSDYNLHLTSRKQWVLSPIQTHDVPMPESLRNRDTMNPLARQLIEMPIDTGDHPDFIDPERKGKFARREHPLGNNPAYPTQAQGGKASNFEEFLASSQYQNTVAALNRYMSRVLGRDWKLADPEQVYEVMGAGMQALQTVKEIEGDYAYELEEMAINLVLSLPDFKAYKEPYEAGEFQIAAKLGTPDLSKIKQSIDQEDEVEAAEEIDPQELDPEVSKRRFINAMIQGSAISKNYAFHLMQPELDKIDPRLYSLYGLLMSFGEFGYFVVPEQMQQAAISGGGAAHAGGSRLTFENGIPVIIAEGVTFPVLVQEIVKGLMELSSRKGLPQNPKAARHVINKADLADHETWSILMGRGLWNQLIQQIDTTEDDLTMHLYDKLVSMPTPQFNATMQQLLAGGTKAKQIIKQLAQEIRIDLEQQHRDDAGYGESQLTRHLLD